MKLTLTHPLYRRQTPSNELPPHGYVDCGSVLEITDAVLGKSIDGNSVWYKGDDGMYYWSGGMSNTEFVIEGNDFLSLPLAQQAEVVEQALDFYYEKLMARIDGFTGLAAGFKKIKEQHINHYALIIQVEKKHEGASFVIPQHLPYNGFSIPTDVVEASLSLSSGLGLSVSRRSGLAIGSIGFVTTRKNETQPLLVTNYHVACADLMGFTPRKTSCTITDVISGPEVVMPAAGNAGSKEIGRLVEGRLDRFNDIALIKLNGDAFITNAIQFIGPINGIRTLSSIKKDFQPATVTLQMFGAISGFRSGVIELCTVTKPIAYLNGNFIHILKGLIQVSKISQPGDSGSALVDEEKKLVGLLVAADEHFSYVLPIENILHNFNLNRPS